MVYLSYCSNKTSLPVKYWLITHFGFHTDLTFEFFSFGSYEFESNFQLVVAIYNNFSMFWRSSLTIAWYSSIVLLLDFVKCNSLKVIIYCSSLITSSLSESDLFALTVHIGINHCQ